MIRPNVSTDQWYRTRLSAATIALNFSIGHRFLDSQRCDGHRRVALTLVGWDRGEPPFRLVGRFIIRETVARENDFYAPTTLTPGTFHHLVAVRTTAGLSIYADATFLGSQGSASAIDTGSGGLSTLGRLTPDSGAPFNRYLNGLLDEIQLYDRALTAGEIQSLFTSIGAGYCTGV